MEESFAEMKSLQMLREELWPSNLSYVTAYFSAVQLCDGWSESPLSDIIDIIAP